jgi:hypothetical protein
MFSNAEMQLIYRVANAPIHMFPYPHILVHDVFPEDFYRQIRTHLPPNNAYKSLKSMGRVSNDYPDEKVVLPLTPDQVATLDEPYRTFWDKTARWLLGGAFGSIMLQKFSPLLQQRFENLAAMQFAHEALVIQDRTNYKLGPHTDTPAKVLSLLFYLPADDSKPHLGTSMYLPADPSFTCDGARHYDFKGFHRLLTMPYVPNTLFAFMKTPNAFHGVEPVSEPGVERALLLYDIKTAKPAAAPSAKPAASTTFSF